LFNGIFTTGSFVHRFLTMGLIICVFLRDALFGFDIVSVSAFTNWPEGARVTVAACTGY
jgi:hypothetical protein